MWFIKNKIKNKNVIYKKKILANICGKIYDLIT